MGNINYYLSRLPGPAPGRLWWTFECQSTLPPFPLLLGFYFWLNHQITKCLPSQVTVSAVSGWHAAEIFPKVFQLLFNASGGKHQKMHRQKQHKQIIFLFLQQTCLEAFISHCTRKYYYFKPRERRISGKCRQPEPAYRCIFNHPVNSLSVYLTPVDFDERKHLLLWVNQHALHFNHTNLSG